MNIPTFTLYPEVGCSCTDRVNRYGVGQCRGAWARGNWTGEQYACYVHQPSTCTDLTDSETIPGQKVSAEACGLRGNP